MHINIKLFPYFQYIVSDAIVFCINYNFLSSFLFFIYILLCFAVLQLKHRKIGCIYTNTSVRPEAQSRVRRRIRGQRANPVSVSPSL